MFACVAVWSEDYLIAFVVITDELHCPSTRGCGVETLGTSEHRPPIDIPSERLITPVRTNAFERKTVLSGSWKKHGAGTVLEDYQRIEDKLSCGRR